MTVSPASNITRTGSQALPLPLPVTQRLLQAYLQRLVSNPLLTKSITLALSYYLQAVISTYLAHPAPSVNKVEAKAKSFLGASSSEKVHRVSRVACAVSKEATDKKALLMAAYGGFISGPMKHYLPILLSKLSALLIPNAFTSNPKRAGLTGLAVGLGVQAPIESLVYVLALAYIGGARSYPQIEGIVRMGWPKIYKATLVIQPISMIVATKLLPVDLWALWGVFVQFSVGLGAQTLLKKKRHAAIRAAAEAEAEAKSKAEKSQ